LIQWVLKRKDRYTFEYEPYKKNKINIKEKIKSEIIIFFRHLIGSLKIVPLIYSIIILFFFYGKIIGDLFNFDILYLQIIIFTLIIIFSSDISKLLKNKYLFFLFILLSVMITGIQLLISVSYSLPIILKAIYMLIGFMIVFILFINFLNIYVNRIELEEIDIKNLK